MMDPLLVFRTMTETLVKNCYHSYTWLMEGDERSLALEVLLNASWLQGYPAAMSQVLVAQGRLIALKSGEWAQAEGDSQNGLVIVVKGLLQSYCAANSDRVVLVGFAGSGSVLGHATRYSGGPRLVTAVCAQDSTLLRISEGALDRVAALHPELWRAIADFTYSHMRSALRMAAEAISLRPPARIAGRLLANAQQDRHRDTAIIRISQELLGEMTGLTRKTINLHLCAFERDGLVRLGYGWIELRDMERLRMVTNAG
ncbi:Crp/Fnr family transcriptional regulator [Croceicoccus sp. F390]|uniref:Crp/Fnr family transcriptional regulator n=1 Tax=Croceicoccus esteveae TaxID=3075597 RepID=A0ABU2ZIU3_9SPHN|nr:Crp/Fnr family transcriptional regulator [Croceicoccus sp. F390]MDT0575943.1 Crp/Fnr family transcriptional regulator [Croceicoccus sp. F390]